MDSSEIDTYLRALDEELEKRPIRKPVRIVVVGGEPFFGLALLIGIETEMPAAGQIVDSSIFLEQIGEGGGVVVAFDSLRMRRENDERMRGIKTIDGKFRGRVSAFA